MLIALLLGGRLLEARGRRRAAEAATALVAAGRVVNLLERVEDAFKVTCCDAGSCVGNDEFRYLVAVMNAEIYPAVLGKLD